MSHLIKIYTVCKFSYFCLWYLKELRKEFAPKEANSFFYKLTSIETRRQKLKEMVFALSERFVGIYKSS